MLKGFRDFVARGNVLDLAVAVVIGAAFAAVVKAFVDGLVTPLVAAVFGKNDLNNVMTFTIHGAVFSVGMVLNALINFLVVAAVIYFLVIVPYNAMRDRFAKVPEDEPRPEDVALLAEIRDILKAQSSGGAA